MYIAEQSTLAIQPVCCLFLLLSLCCLPHAGYGGGTTTRWMVVTTIKGTRIRTTLPKNVCWLYYLSVVVFCGCYLFSLPHADYGRGIMTRRMVATMTGRKDNIAEESTLAILPVCCFLFVFFISLLSPTCWLWRRDKNEVDGGDDDQRDQRTTSPKKVRWLYYLSVVVVFCGCYLFVVSHMLAMAEGQQRGGWWR